VRVFGLHLPQAARQGSGQGAARHAGHRLLATEIRWRLSASGTRPTAPSVGRGGKGRATSTGRWAERPLFSLLPLLLPPTHSCSISGHLGGVGPPPHTFRALGKPHHGGQQTPKLSEQLGVDRWPCPEDNGLLQAEETVSPGGDLG